MKHSSALLACNPQPSRLNQIQSISSIGVFDAVLPRPDRRRSQPVPGSALATRWSVAATKLADTELSGTDRCHSPAHIHFGSSEPTSMTYKHREALIDKIVDQQPSLQGFVRKASGDMRSGSWDLVSYSFRRGFETMWDLARADLTGQLHLPLLSLWRQGLELAIKSTILESAGTISGKSRPQSSASLSAVARYSCGGRLQG